MSVVMYKKISFVSAIVALAATASAHGTVNGGTVEFHWSVWPESHVGPIITYVAPYTGDIASVAKENLKWTKIEAAGYDNGEWAAIKLIGMNNSWPVRIPETLVAGKYVFRHEIIALHGAGEINGAQAYPQCLNIEVTGSGTVKPKGVVGTALYTAEEKGIVFNPYAASIDYPIPGPPLFGGASSSSPTTPTTPSTSAAPISPGNATAPVIPSASASAIATPEAETPAPPSTTPSAAPVPTSSPTPSTGGQESSDLPTEFTLETFIAWLQAKASSASKARRHPRSLF